uniref:Jacalin-type lectin domain-containing protein n=1 Tax=Oryza brachyantha TaxID=4533 RepID=J3N1H2_ORYBR
MELITGAAGSLLPKLAILLISNEHSLQRGARSQARFLRSELESIQAALEEASGVPKRQLDKQFRLWVASVQEMSYDIEDVVDALHLQLSLTGSPRRRRSGKLGVVREAIDMCIGMMLPCKAHRRRSVFARRIEGINELVREVAERRDRYGVVAAAAVTKSSTETSHPWLMAMYRDVRKLVGLDGPVKEVASLLLQDQTGIMSQKQLKVVSIVGVGGLGKTTLANVTYQQVRDQFMCHAFVSVSSKLPDLKRILISIIRQFMRPDCVNTETWDEMDLINMIREFVIDKRYLVVLDDIWDTSTWAYISCALTENNCCSRIITTTRIIGVAEASCSDVDGTIYKLKPLSCDDSRKLFYKRIFNCEYGCPAELREVSGKILKKIGGLPLAIMTTASLLANKPRTIAEWYSVHTSIGTGLEKSPTVENMRWILSVSYYDLPLHLRACLLYMCIFPSGYIISTGQLILRWISEEFINKQQHEGNLYEIGEKYLYELINRSMIQPESIDAHGRVQTCRVHDMVLDLISSLSSEENFVTILDDHQETTIPNKVRRLCLQNCKEEHTRLQLESMSLSHVRSLLAFHCSSNLMPPFSRFNVLRVLDLEGCRDLENRHIKDIGKLFHLRHIGLKDTKVTNLPKEVGKLYCLQTLDLTRTSITELPSSIVGLKQLMCLYVEKTVRLPHGIGRMKSLRELSEIDISLSPSIAEELGNLKELRVLHFFVEGRWHTRYEKALINSLRNLNKVQLVSIFAPSCSFDFILQLGYMPSSLQYFFSSTYAVSKLPRWISSNMMSCLSTLDTVLETLQQEDMEMLGALPSLQILRLEVYGATKKTSLVSRGNAFCGLVVFWIAIPAMGLVFSEGAMPKLENLELVFSVRETKEAFGNFEFGLDNISDSLSHMTIRINCTCSNKTEVGEANDAVRYMASLSSNQTCKIEVIRHFEDDMALDEGERGKLHQLVHQNHGKRLKQKAALPTVELPKIGPWGGTGGRAREITVVPPCHLDSVTICSGAIVDALAFSYRDAYGQRHSTPSWGGVGGISRTIKFGESEVVTEVSGTIGPFHHLNNVITSLSIVTNLRSYGPFGSAKGIPFSTSTLVSNSSIVGFFGRSGSYLDAIGVYVCSQL